MDSDKLMHDLIVERIRIKVSGDYKEIRVNPEGDPDLVLSNHGLTLAAVEVETERSITPERAEKWKEMAGSDCKLILMVPKSGKVKAMDLLWKHGIADRVGLGSYDIQIHLP
jgi:hypothetical protein